MSKKNNLISKKKFKGFLEEVKNYTPKKVTLGLRASSDFSKAINEAEEYLKRKYELKWEWLILRNRSTYWFTEKRRKKYKRSYEKLLREVHSAYLRYWNYHYGWRQHILFLYPKKNPLTILFNEAININSEKYTSTGKNRFTWWEEVHPMKLPNG